ncbi:MAG: DUF4113 domain-containing protein [Rhodospirillales bacterium]|nr:DUF4113 domain-containing protein [Acetobacter sp.]
MPGSFPLCLAAAISQAKHTNQEARTANERFEQGRQLARSFLRGRTADRACAGQHPGAPRTTVRATTMGGDQPQEWRMRRERQTPCYTTRVGDVRRVER